MNNSSGTCSWVGTNTVTPSAIAGMHFPFASFIAQSDGSCGSLTWIDTTTAPIVQFEINTPINSGTVSNPAYWFDMSTQLWMTSTTGDGTTTAGWSVASPQVVALGDVGYNGSTFTLFAAPFMYGTSPFAIMANGGNGLSGSFTVNGTTAFIDGYAHFSSFLCYGAGIINSHVPSATIASLGGIAFTSQWPAAVSGTCSLAATGAIAGTVSGQTSTSSAFTPLAGGQGGAGGGTTAINGGGRRQYPNQSTPLGGGTSAVAGMSATTGLTIPGAGPLLREMIQHGFGAQGAPGFGDGTHLGGFGGQPSGFVYIKTTFLLISSTGRISADGGPGGPCAGGTSLSGAGGGAGNILLEAMGYNFGNNLFATQVTANGGLHSTTVCGTTLGTDGGNGAIAAVYNF
jgi:hypothetical protein